MRRITQCACTDISLIIMRTQSLSSYIGSFTTSAKVTGSSRINCQRCIRAYAVKRGPVQAASNCSCGGCKGAMPAIDALRSNKAILLCDRWAVENIREYMDQNAAATEAFTKRRMTLTSQACAWPLPPPLVEACPAPMQAPH